MRVIDLYEQMKDSWPASEPLDNPYMEISEMYTEDSMDEDIQEISEWMERVKVNFPDLYVSQAVQRGKK